MSKIGGSPMETEGRLAEIRAHWDGLQLQDQLIFGYVPELIELAGKLDEEAAHFSDLVLSRNLAIERLQERVRELEQRFSDETNSEHIRTIGDLL